MNKNIFDFWAFPYEPRENQITALEWLAEQTVPYLLLEAPVGAGKSNIGVTFSKFLTGSAGNSFILTPQRILQEQYERSFKRNKQINLASFYGKSNYTCAEKRTTCEIGSIVKPQCANCPHAKAKKAAQLANNTVLNYKLALTSFAFTETFKPRRLMILDECHTLENHLIDFDALQITEWRCKKYNLRFKNCRSMGVALDWMRDYYLPQIKEVAEDMQDRCEPLMEKTGSELTRAEINQLRELSGLLDHVDEAMTMSIRTMDYMRENFVLVHDPVMFQFKRLKGAYSFHKIVVPFAKRFLFMSSTILNKDGFCEDLNIPEDQTAFLSLGSEFPTEHRPVFYMPQCKMNAKWKEDENRAGRKRMIQTTKQLLNDIHQKDTGLIHTGNFEIAKWLVNHLENEIPHHIYHHNPDSGDDRNNVITAFQDDGKPSILISPSSTEGLDLKDDLGRFAIFTKVPFGYLGDQWIKKRMEMSIRWYHRRALIDIIQGGGRIVRSSDDHGVVYVLDQSWAYLYKQAYYMIPRWWRDSYSSV